MSVWRKSSRSNGNGGNNCVEVAFFDDGAVYVRNSRRPDDDPSVFSRSEWDAFIVGVKLGEFDLPAAP